MMKEVDQKQIFEILEKLPEEVKDVLFSEKTAEDIDRICKKYGVNPGKVSEVAKRAGQVLLGILPLEYFAEALEEMVNLKKDTAKNVAQGMRLSVFSQVESFLKKPPMESGGMPSTKESKKPSASDVYREQV